MERVLDWVEEHFGSIPGYLASLGVGQAELRAIRKALGASSSSPSSSALSADPPQRPQGSGFTAERPTARL